MIFKGKRTVIAAVISALLVSSVAVGAQKGRTKREPVAGEDDFRSATSYIVSAMEHCKAINKLARSRGALNVDLTREHGAEVVRSISAATRHAASFRKVSGTTRTVATSTNESNLPVVDEGELTRLATALDQTIGAGTPDKKAVVQAVTNLYLATKGYLAAHKAEAKVLGISAASPPRNPAPRKPKKPKKGTTEADPSM